MKLLDRYLQSIKTFLSGKDQDDILRELRESLLSQMDDRERSLGRPLEMDEAAEIIRENGPPFVVAARYGPHGSLIGPTLFPFYWQALKWGLTIALSLRLIIAVVSVLLSPRDPGEIVAAMLAVPGVAIPVFAALTAAFAGLEWAMSMTNVRGKKFNWNPQSLPKLRRESKLVPRHESVAAVVFGLAGLVWLRSVPHAPFLVLGPSANFLAPAPIWAVIYGPLLALATAGVLQALVMLVRPYWAAFNTWSRLALNVATFIVVWVLFRAGTWLVAVDSSPNRGHWEAIAGNVNHALYYCFAGCVVVLPVLFAFDLYRRLRGKATAAKVNACLGNGFAAKS